MGKHLVNDPHYRTTDHSVEIAEINRVLKDEIMPLPIEAADQPFVFTRSTLIPNASTVPLLLAGVVLKTAATLLQTHDDTGISLDEWDGPRELVEYALNLCGYEDEAFLENHV